MFVTVFATTIVTLLTLVIHHALLTQFIIILITGCPLAFIHLHTLPPLGLTLITIVSRPHSHLLPLSSSNPCRSIPYSPILVLACDCLIVLSSLHYLYLVNQQ